MAALRAPAPHGDAQAPAADRGRSHSSAADAGPSGRGDALDASAASAEVARGGFAKSSRMIHQLVHDCGNDAARCHERWVRRRHEGRPDDAGRADAEAKRTAARLRAKRRALIYRRLAEADTGDATLLAVAEQDARLAAAFHVRARGDNSPSAGAAVFSSEQQPQGCAEDVGDEAEDASDSESLMSWSTRRRSSSSLHAEEVVEAPPQARKSVPAWKALLPVLKLVASPVQREPKADDAARHRLPPLSSRRAGAEPEATPTPRGRHTSAQPAAAASAGVTPRGPPPLGISAGRTEGMAELKAEPSRPLGARSRKVVEVPRLRSRYRDQGAILGGLLRDGVPTAKRFHMNVAAGLGLDERDWDPRRVYDFKVRDLELAAIRKRERDRNEAATKIQLAWLGSGRRANTRLRLAERREATRRIQGWWGCKIRFLVPMVRRLAEKEKTERAAVRIQAHFRRHKVLVAVRATMELQAMKKKLDVLKSNLMQEEIKAADVLKAKMRSHLAAASLLALAPQAAQKLEDQELVAATPEATPEATPHSTPQVSPEASTGPGSPTPTSPGTSRSRRWSSNAKSRSTNPVLARRNSQPLLFDTAKAARRASFQSLG